jgi:hypothetical protein
VVEVEELLFRGHPEVVDADLADYFGSIPHAELLKSVSRRIVDRRVLHLIKMWLDCPVEETESSTEDTHDRGAGQAARHPAGRPPIRPSPHLPELWRGLDQPERGVREAASEEGDPGRDKQHPDRLLDPVKPYSAF